LSSDGPIVADIGEQGKMELWVRVQMQMLVTCSCSEAVVREWRACRNLHVNSVPKSGTQVEGQGKAADKPQQASGA